MWIWKDGVLIDDGGNGFDVTAQTVGTTGYSFIGDYSGSLSGDWELDYLVLDPTGAYSPVVSADSDADGLSDAWEVAHYGAVGSVAPGDDTDGDSYTALQEMVFGMDPNVDDSGNAPLRNAVVDDAGTLKMQVRFRRPQNHADLNVTYALESCTDLAAAGWSAETASPTTTPDGDNEWVTYLLPFPGGAETSTFFRCKATPNP